MNKVFALACTIILCSTMNLVNAQSLKLMSYNIRLDIASDGENAWPNRKGFLSSQIQYHEPDVLGVQEATPNQVMDLNNALTQYKGVGIAREGKGKGEAASIYFKKNRFELLETKTFWLSPTPNTISKGWDAAYNRVCTYVLLKDIRKQQIFWVFNTHLDHVGEEAKSNGLKLILKTIKARNKNNYPVFLMGDFNTKPSEERITNLKKSMVDAKEVSFEKPFGPNGTFNGFQYNTPVKDRIDYIFLSKNNPFKVLKYAVLTDSKDLKFPSDHFPVFVELLLIKNKK